MGGKDYPIVFFENTLNQPSTYDYNVLLNYPDDRVVMLYGHAPSRKETAALKSDIQKLLNETGLQKDLVYPSNWPSKDIYDPAVLRSDANVGKQANANAEKPVAVVNKNGKIKYAAVVNPADSKPGPALTADMIAAEQARHAEAQRQQEAEAASREAARKATVASRTTTKTEHHTVTHSETTRHETVAVETAHDDAVTYQPASDSIENTGRMQPASVRPGVTNRNIVAKAETEKGMVPVSNQTRIASAEPNHATLMTSDPLTGKVSAQSQNKPAAKSGQTGTRKKKAGKNGKPVVHFPSQPGPATSLPAHPSGFKVPAPLPPQQQAMLDQALHHYRRANAYGQRNKIDQAIVEYQKALLLYPAMADAHVGLSSAYARQNDWEKVIEEATLVAKPKPIATFMDPQNQPRAWYNLSTAYCAAGDYDEAKKYFKKAQLTGYPNTDRLWNYLQQNCKHSDKIGRVF